MRFETAKDLTPKLEGWPIWQGTFLPFGQEWNPQLTTNHYKFTGHERDSESNLDMEGARYYNSTMGRFMTPDWSAAPVPVPYADLSDPQTLNLYGYVRNNPMSHTDTDGHDDDDLAALGKEAYNEVADAANLVNKVTNYIFATHIKPVRHISPSSEDQAAAMKKYSETLFALSFADGGGELSAAERMARIRQLGKEGEILSGWLGDKRRIESLTGTAKFRVPDMLNELAKQIGEVKNNGGKLNLTPQMKDFVAYAEQKGYEFIVKVKDPDKLSKPLLKELKRIHARIEPL